MTAHDFNLRLFHKVFLILGACIAYTYVKGQNLQFAELYYNSNFVLQKGVNLMSNGDEVLTCYSAGTSDFRPNRENDKIKLSQNRDAFLVCQNSKGNYQWFTQFRSKVQDLIYGVTISENDEIFVFFVSHGSDSIWITTDKSNHLIIPPENQRKSALYTIKLSKNGEYIKHVFFGFVQTINFLPSLRYSFEASENNQINFVMSSIGKNNIPGTTDTLVSKSHYAYASFTMNCFDMAVKLNRVYEFEGLEEAKIYNNVLEFKSIVNAKTATYDSLKSNLLYFNGNLQHFRDSIFSSKSSRIITAVSLSDTLYVIHDSPKSPIPFSPSFNFGNVNMQLAEGRHLITKWVVNKLADSMLFSAHLDHPNLFLDIPNHEMYLTIEVTKTNDEDSIFEVKFFKGNDYLFERNTRFLWTKIIKDSIAWASNITSNLLSTEPLISERFFVNEDFQYIAPSIIAWIDLDPGDYIYQFHPEVYRDWTIMAKYNCYPNAIFTYKQTAHKIEFINQSAGSDSFKWNMGIEMKPITTRNPVFYYPAVGEYWVTLIAYNSCGTDTFKFPVYIDEVVGVEDATTFKFEVYPNPCTTEVIINSDLEAAELQLFDPTGRLILEQKHSFNSKIDVSNLGSGVYIIVCKSGSRRISKLIVKD